MITLPPPRQQTDGIGVSKQKTRTKETFHLPTPPEWEEQTTSEDEPEKCTIPSWLKFGEKDWLGDEIIDAFLSCNTYKCPRMRYLSCSMHTILNHRTIDILLHDHVDGQVTHPTIWDRAVMPIGIKNSRGETNHWCLVLIENEYSSLTLFEPIENMRRKRSKEMQQLCSDMEFYTNKPWQYTCARTQAQKDGYNCGVHICAIGAALLQEKGLTDISPSKYRRKIRNTIQRHYNSIAPTTGGTPGRPRT